MKLSSWFEKKFDLWVHHPEALERTCALAAMICAAAAGALVLLH